MLSRSAAAIVRQLRPVYKMKTRCAAWTTRGGRSKMSLKPAVISAMSASDTKLKPQEHVRPTVNLRSHLVSYLFALAGLMPIVLVAWYVITHGSQGPVGDQGWDTVYIGVKTQTSTLIPEDFFVLSLGHRPAVIRLLTAFFTIFTHFNTGILCFAAFTNTLL